MAMLTMKNMTITNRRRFCHITLIVFAGVCASMLMHWITAQGPGVNPDSTTYIDAARSLLAGNGFFIQGEPMTHFPPGYPLLIGLVDWLYPGDVLQATRFVAALFYGVNLVLLSLAVYICTRYNFTATISAMLIFLFSATTISTHANAWSEAPFIAFSMTSFLLLSYHIKRPNLYLLLLVSLMAGFAAATRYVGIVLIPTIALVFFMLDYRSLRPKIKDTIIFAVVSTLPLVSWFIRNILTAQSAADREFAFHPFSLNHAKKLIHSMYDFALPICISGWTKTLHVGVAAVLFFVGFVMLYRKNYIKQNATSIGIVLPSICFIYSLLYIVFLVISISFFDYAIPTDSRILLPVLLTLTIVFITLAWSLSERLNRRWIWYSFVSLVLFSVSINLSSAIEKAVYIHKNGSKYTSRDWQQSEIIFYLSDTPDDRKIYSNGPDVIRFYTGKKVVTIPKKASSTSRRLNKNFQEQLSLMFQECIEGEALVAYFNNITWRWYLPSVQEIESIGNLPVLRRMQDGVIYGRH